MQWCLLNMKLEQFRQRLSLETPQNKNALELLRVLELLICKQEELAKEFADELQRISDELAKDDLEETPPKN